MTGRTQVGLIGAGKIGRVHAENIVFRISQEPQGQMRFFPLFVAGSRRPLLLPQLKTHMAWARSLGPEARFESEG